MYPMSITFLGTSSGGGPTENRNCSSLVCDFFEGDNLWMVDCAEGTTRQFVRQPNRPGIPRVRINQLTKLFVTHLHADHIMGIPTLLRNILRPPRLDTSPPSNAVEHRKFPSFQIYGPCGLRSFIRQNLKMTFTRTDDTYVVHELLKDGDPITPCNAPPDPDDPTSGTDYRDWDVLHCNELPGQDILADEHGLWRNIATHTHTRRATQILIRAGPILHREPCIGYVFDETTPPRRKIVILGDTYDPSPIIPLCADPSPTLLIHEATDSTISPEKDSYGKLSKRKIEDVMKTTLARGHSTPIMAGEFAKRVNAQKLVLNHIGSRFPAPRVTDTRYGFARDLMNDMEEKATSAWDPPVGSQTIVALDFMRVLVPDPGSRPLDSIPDPLSPSTSSAAPMTSFPALPHPIPCEFDPCHQSPEDDSAGTNTHTSNSDFQRSATCDDPDHQSALNSIPDSRPTQPTDDASSSRRGRGRGRSRNYRRPRSRAGNWDRNGDGSNIGFVRNSGNPARGRGRGHLTSGDTTRGRGMASRTTFGGRYGRPRGA